MAQSKLALPPPVIMPTSDIKNITSNLAVYCIGSTGPPWGSCVTTGPFANSKLVLDYGPPPSNMSLTADYAGRCLKRNFNVSLVNHAFQRDINVVAQLAQTPFVNFTVAMDKDIASREQRQWITWRWSCWRWWRGKSNISTITRLFSPTFSRTWTNFIRKMMNVWSSINDPIFYTCTMATSTVFGGCGRSKQKKTSITFGGPVYPLGRGPGTATLNYTMEMGAFMAPSLPVYTVMDTVNTDGRGFLCYEYETYPENPRA